MFNPKPYRDKAADYAERGKTAAGSHEAHALAKLERSFTSRADNEQWLSDNHEMAVQTPAGDIVCDTTALAQELAQEEERVLRCLGAALIMQWNTLPKKLQRELFDNAGTMGELCDIAALRGQIARFLHKHKDEHSGA